MDKEFKYNSSRYYDPTAYMALNNVQKGENMDNLKIGEVWEYMPQNRNETFYVLVLADDGNIVTFIRLIDSETDKTDIEIPCRGMMYASSRMIQYGFSTCFEDYVKTVPETDFQDVMDKIAANLGIKLKVVEKVVEKEIYTEPVEQISEVPSFDVELERTKAQLEVYKGLYESLMKQMIGK